MSLDKKIFLKEVGSRIRNRRKELGLTQEQTAELSGLDVRSFQKIENGQAESRVFNLYRISTALKIEIAKLLGTF